MSDLFFGLSTVFMVAGLFFAFASVVGVIRFPDVYTRLHASTKAIARACYRHGIVPKGTVIDEYAEKIRGDRS